jgi:hypothetical protein
MLGFNLRRSGFNVKSFQVNYFNATSFPDESLPAVKNAWVTACGLQNNGAPYMGRKAVREMVVAAMKSSIDGNQDLREEQRQFKLIATPNYPELIPNMVALNNERSQTAFVVGDTQCVCLTMLMQSLPGQQMPLVLVKTQKMGW